MFKIGFLLVFVEVPVERVEFECKGTKLTFLTVTSKATARLCAWGMFEVSWRQWSGRPSFSLLRSGDDYQLLSVQISRNSCQRDVNNHLPFFTCWRLTSSDTEIPDVLQEFSTSDFVCGSENYWNFVNLSIESENWHLYTLLYHCVSLLSGVLLTEKLLRYRIIITGKRVCYCNGSQRSSMNLCALYVYSHLQLAIYNASTLRDILHHCHDYQMLKDVKCPKQLI